MILFKRERLKHFPFIDLGFLFFCFPLRIKKQYQKKEATPLFFILKIPTQYQTYGKMKYKKRTTPL